MSPETHSPLRVLYLEDNIRDRQILEATLQADGLACEIAFANGKAEFQNALSLGKLDLIISDFTLPAFDGMSALALAREACPELPFLFFSGTIGEDRAIASLKAGATDYVLKDNVKQLGAAVRRAIQEAEERQRRRQAEEALKESNARLQQVAETLNQVFWLYDTNSLEMLYISPAFERFGDALAPASTGDSTAGWKPFIQPIGSVFKAACQTSGRDNSMTPIESFVPTVPFAGCAIGPFRFGIRLAPYTGWWGPPKT